MLSGSHSLWTNPRFHSLTLATFFLIVVLFIFEARRAHQIPAFTSLDVPSIPRTIWHVFLHKREIPPTLQPVIHSWTELNPQHNYHLVETVEATNILFDLYSTRPEIVHVYQRLESTVMRADFLRYVLLAKYGGVYTDVDTLALQPIDQWIPDRYINHTRVVVGIEYDQRNDTERHVSMPHSINLCQWTMMATANHPLLWHVVNEAMWTIQERADSYGTDIEHLRPTDQEVITTTGPGLWTAAIIKYLRTRGYPSLAYDDFSSLTEPLLLDDVLIMPVDAFGSGQPHSGSTEYKDAEGEEMTTAEKPVNGALARHLFSMSWRHGCTGVQGDGSPCW